MGGAESANQSPSWQIRTISNSTPDLCSSSCQREQFQAKAAEETSALTMLRFCAREATDRELKGSNLKLFAKFNNWKNITTGFSSNCTTFILLASIMCKLLSKNQTFSNSLMILAQWWTFRIPIGPQSSMTPMTEKEFQKKKNNWREKRDGLPNREPF